MFMVTYYKKGTAWFLDYPEYLQEGGSIEDLKRTEGFHELLELVGRGSLTISFHIGFAPFDGADVATLTETIGRGSGGIISLTALKGSRSV